MLDKSLILKFEKILDPDSKILEQDMGRILKMWLCHLFLRQRGSFEKFATVTPNQLFTSSRGPKRHLLHIWWSKWGQCRVLLFW